MRHKKNLTPGSFRQTGLKSAVLSVIAATTSTLACAQVPSEVEEIVVTGSRQIIQDQIAIKRTSTQIVDGLTASDIGDLPALSIGEALESISGASSHRENGGATEISIRGLGPFLSATHINGREATNGSGDRSVNFSQFPSELTSKVAISKTQSASTIEGGVAGVIQIDTLKPLEYGKRRFQADIKGNFNPDQQDVSDSIEGDFGHRATASYIDQFEFNNGAALGVSIGVQNSEISQPESEVRSSSPAGTSRFACLNEPNTASGAFRSGSGNCNPSFSTLIDPDTGLGADEGSNFFFAPSSRGFRANDTSDQRDALFVALQFQPNDDWDINLDFQRSVRTQREERHDLNFAEQRRVTPGVTPEALMTTDTGAVLAFANESRIESNSELFDREETYSGGGINVRFDVNEVLTVTADYSHSETNRIEEQISVRLQSDRFSIADVQNDGTLADTGTGTDRPNIFWDRDSGIPQFVVTDFDVTDPNLFSDSYRVRLDSDEDRTNTIDAFRTDFDYKLEGSFFQNIKTGVRYSKLEYLDLDFERDEIGSFGIQNNPQELATINRDCRNEIFPNDNFLSNIREGDLITNVDADGNVLEQGTGNEWATFDTRCVTDGLLALNGSEFGFPDQILEKPQTIDVTEITHAIYAQADFETTFNDTPIFGNFGLRVVDTRVDSIGFRTDFVITEDVVDQTFSIAPGDGPVERFTRSNSYVEFLPSFSYVADISNSFIVRGGIFRGLSRANPSALGFERSFNTNNSEQIDTIGDLISNVQGSGNPGTDPLTSWNLDTSFEWYANDDSFLAVGLYYKQFTGGFNQVTEIETLTVGGQPIDAEFTSSQTTNDTSDLFGIEITGSHRFSYLPGALSGLGIKGSLNLADSNFEFEDSLLGDLFVNNVDGSTTSGCW